MVGLERCYFEPIVATAAKKRKDIAMYRILRTYQCTTGRACISKTTGAVLCSLTREYSVGQRSSWTTLAHKSSISQTLNITRALTTSQKEEEGLHSLPSPVDQVYINLAVRMDRMLAQGQLTETMVLFDRIRNKAVIPLHTWNRLLQVLCQVETHLRVLFT